MSDEEDIQDVQDYDVGSFDEEDLDMDVDEKDIEIINENNDTGIYYEKKRIADEDRISPPFLTKYERARILGARALQLSKNAPLCVDAEGETDPYKIAERELQERKIPFVIRRHLPDGSYEDWKINELVM
mmetsp:Transcript_6755/g.7540  ORF Transcript_6755/g.7540 Transcript_6755/m.7540 type:complete len:130 (+) Transcript_6755:56-445(+)|eukprot:CAMPEP_0205804936 /NCGR_PEP_ID=MMETSP0205-20121125/7985_1 /ASSEMBLY_ACC=CAM_ASM_000278 /TAXON_ID=36767 /ORGANISM="Euplotes focardii, Strain TN1" /LENGTH=129 /DNA_ID=CAMNT_0053075303 /DNA_START=31 /DNA_END=420 /DNA_ORIENTATION=-